MNAATAELHRPINASDRLAEPPTRIRIVPFDEIRVGTERRYRVKELIPMSGLALIWGPPKCGKSYWIFDLEMHVALGWDYCGLKVQQGPVVHCAFEGQHGLPARVEAFRLERLGGYEGPPVPFYLERLTLDLVKDHRELIAAIRLALDSTPPAIVTLDTLNRSLAGSENSDEDMSAYIGAADAIREAFDCAVVIVHHCGTAGDRPRGHTSLTGAVDVQISVKRNLGGNVAEVELAKDGPEGRSIGFKLEQVEVGTDIDGEPIYSCIVVPQEAPAVAEAGPRLSANQQTMFALLHEAGERGLPLDVWNEKAREAGIGNKRRADLTDIRMALKSKGLIYEHMNGWSVKQ